MKNKLPFQGLDIVDKLFYRIQLIFKGQAVLKKLTYAAFAAIISMGIALAIHHFSIF